MRAFLLALGFQLRHHATCHGGGGRTRPSHEVWGRLGTVTIGRLQGPTGRAVFTSLPPVVWRDRPMRPEVAREALLATHGGLSLERCAMLDQISPMARYRLVWALGPQSLVMVRTRCGLVLPSYCRADETHRRCLTGKVYLPTSVRGRVIWPRGYPEEASPAALTQSYRVCQWTARQPQPASRVRGLLTDGFDSPNNSRRTLFPGARLGLC